MGDIGSVTDLGGKLIDEDMKNIEHEQKQEEALDEASKELAKPLPPPAKQPDK